MEGVQQNLPWRSHLFELLYFLERFHELLYLSSSSSGVMVIEILDLTSNADKPLLQVFVLFDTSERLIA